MSKSSTSHLFACYIWLADTIMSRGPISRPEIDRLWRNSYLNEDFEDKIPERTFHRYRNAIQDLFGIEICCDKAAGSLYYIANNTISNSANVKSWLLSQFAINSTLHSSRQLQGRIIYENIPSGSKYVTQIVDAMRFNQQLKMTHLKFSSDEPHTYTINPYCLKIFKQRWYLLGKTNNYKEPRIYALDRITALETLQSTFTMPKDFDAEAWFVPYYGVYCGKQYKPELIRAKVRPETADYLRSLPLHHSQKENTEKDTNGYVEFCWYVAPTFDFIQELRTHGSFLEILSPEWLRQEFQTEAEKTIEKYKA